MRMAIIGQRKSKNLVAISYSAQKSEKIVRDSQLTVGSVSEVREPIHSKICLGEDRNDPIFQTHQATIFINNVIYEDFPPIPMVSQHNKSAVFRYTVFGMQKLYSLPVLALGANIRFRKESSSACMQKNSASSCTVAARISSTDVENEADDLLSGYMTHSNQLSALFCNKDARLQPLTSVELPFLAKP